MSSSSRKKLPKGTLRLHPRGFGFVQIEGQKESVFIPRNLTNGAVDGDLVEIHVTGKSEKGFEGEISKVLQRGRSHLAGTLIDKKEGRWLVHAPLLGLGSPFQLISDDRTLSRGDRVITQVIEWGKESGETKAKLVKVIGSIDDPTIDIEALVETYELEEEFSEETLAEVEKIGEKVKPSDLEGREDLRKLETFTIDPETAQDFDDALSLKIISGGDYELGVHIADVSYYVKPSTSLDQEALLRCNSVYFPRKVLPMLPKALSNELCSLKPKVTRLTLSVFMLFDKEGHLKNYRIVRSAIKSQMRFTYPEAREILEGKKKSKHSKTLLLMADLCHRLKARRAERGSLELSVPQFKLQVNDKGEATHFDVEEYDISHQLVEEFMLKANEIVATHLAKNNKPLAFRIHESPSPEDIKEFSKLAHSFGFKISKDPDFNEIQAFLDQAKESPLGHFLVTSFIRTMKLASYSIENVGHYGLGLEYYTHFTSPIRRYIDLMVHRSLFDEVDSTMDLEAIALACSEKERIAAKAENEAILLKKLRLLLKRKKSERLEFQGLITEVKPNGIVFAIPELVMEGFLPLSSLLDDYYHYNNRRNILQGERTHRQYKVGMDVAVYPREIDLIFLNVRWELAHQIRPKTHGTKKRRRRK